MPGSDTIAELKVRVTIDYAKMQEGAQKVKSSVNGMADNAKTKMGKFGSIISSISPKFGEMATSAKKAGTKMQESLQKMGVSAGVAKIAVIGAFAAIAVAVVAAVKRVVTAIWNFMSETAQMAQDAQDTEEYIVAAFGSMGSSALSWAQSVSSAYGIYDTTVEQTAAQLAVLYRSTGIADQKATDMAKSFTTLAYDISAAFSNISVEDAQAALLQLAQGSIKGLKALGISMTDTELQAYAVSKGIARSGETLSSAQKQLALYSVAMAKLGSVEGKYVSDSSDYNKVLTERNAKVSELKETIGGALKPLVNAINTTIGYIAQGLTYFLKSIIAFFKTIYSFFKGLLMPVIDTIKTAVTALWGVMQTIFNSIVGALKTLVNAIANLFGMDDIWKDSTSSAEDAAEATDDVTESTEEATEAAKEYAGLASFDKLTTLSDSTTDTDEDITTSLIDAEGATSGVSDAMDGIAAKAEEIGSKIWGWLNPIKWITDIDWAGYWNGFMQWGGTAWSAIKTAASNIWAIWTSLGGTLWSTVSSWGTSAWESISGAAGKAWETITGWADSAWESITGFATDMWNVVKTVAESIWSSITSTVGDALTSIGTSIYDTLKGMYDRLFGWVKDLVEKVTELIDKVQSVTGGTVNTITDTAGGWWGGIKDTLGFASGGVFAPNSPQLAILGDNKTEPEVAAPISSISKAVVDALSKVGNTQSSSTINLTIEMDGQVLARKIYNPLKTESKRRGTIL